MKKINFLLKAILTISFFYILLFLSQITYKQNSPYYFYKDHYTWITVEIYTAVDEAHSVYDIPTSEICAIINSESEGHSRAISSVGARGLMQVLPKYHYKGNPNDLYDIQLNIFKGTQIWKECKQTSKGNLIKAIVYYNAGPFCSLNRYKNWDYADEIIKNIMKTYKV
jgi:soluble lytic murein transglycosylase-like protein